MSRNIYRRGGLIAGGFGLVVVFGAASHAGDSARLTAEDFRLEYIRPAETPFPEDNGYTHAKAELGRTLFFDTRLSGSGDISCGSCHNPRLAWGDGRATAVGTGGQVLGRRTPTVLNTAWAAALFWDGRAETLEAQALGPIQAPPEMNLPLDSLIARLSGIQGYAPLFEAAFPGEPITADAVARAIATFERTVVSGSAPFDAWVDGNDSAITPEAKQGFVVFNTRGNCAACHSGWRLTDDSFHDIGVAGNDPGRAAVIGDIEAVRFAFKTPTLRNVVERAPYMHDGSEATLEDVIELYDAGGRHQRPSLSPEIRPLGLTAAEKRALLAFLKTLSSADPVVSTPALPH